MAVNRATRMKGRVAAVAMMSALLGCGGGAGSDGGAQGTGTGVDGNAAGGNGGNTGSTSPAPVAAGPALSAVRTGQATFYGANGDGHCSFGPSPGDRMVVAMNQADYANAAACGEYLSVTGPKGQVMVRVTDECPECRSGDLDLSAEAFARIADPVAGRVPIRWNVVAGEVSGALSFHYKEGSSVYWVAIQVRNARLPVTRLEIQPQGASQWTEVGRTSYNYFVYPMTIASGPLRVRVTALGGATVEQTLPSPQGGLLVQGTQQFP